jgi:hypothetical protein
MNLNKKKLPKRIKRRIELSKMFYPLERSEERKWGRIFNSKQNIILDYFGEIALEKKYLQEKVDANKIIWKEKDGSIECMFCFIENISDLESVRKVFSKIKKLSPLFTYAVVHQQKDGDGIYDIFRFSKFSYLEHCNRVRYTGKKKISIKNGGI